MLRRIVLCDNTDMPRKPDGDVARTEHITARFRPEDAATLDRLRGETPRSRYLEVLVAAEAKRQARRKKTN
jgi:hypothetical protein